MAGKGALIVIGDGPEVIDICSGGFILDAAFSPQRLSEISKMDGAIILSSDLSRIMRANVHLVPDPDLPTSETGTRHRTAERVARSLKVPVISVSERMTTITVYLDDDKYPLDPIPRVLARADQAVQALERYRSRLDAIVTSLSTLEIQDLVTVRDVASALQRAEMLVRISTEAEGFILELGTDGRMVRLQLVELMAGVLDERRHMVRDYVSESPDWTADDALSVLTDLDTDQLLDLVQVASVLHLDGDSDDLDEVLQPRGYRLLSRIPRISNLVIEGVIERFGLLPKLLRANVDELAMVDGVGSRRARVIKDGLSRLAESSILDRYV